MKIIVCGAGRVGTGIARQLAGEDNDVTVIDASEELIRKMSDSLDVKTIHGVGAHPDVLEKAGAAEADLLIAVTISDEINMIACQVAHSIFNVPTKIARIRSQSYLDPLWHDLYRKDHLPIDVIISPETEVAQAILRRLHVPGALDMAPFADGRVRLAATRCLLGCPVLGMSVDEVMEKSGAMSLRIIGLARDNDFLMPSQVRVLRANDDVYFVVAEKDVRKAMSLFGHEEKEAHRVVILGGGNIGLSLAQMLEKEEQGVRVRLIEQSRERAEAIVEHLGATTVIRGSGMDIDILKEANIQNSETIIAVTNDDKVNILASLLAKREGCERAVTLVNNLGYTGLVSNLGIDAVISPREVTASIILQHVRRGRIRAVHSICGGMAEVMEAEVVANMPIAGKPIADMELPKGIMIVALVRGEDVHMPDDATIVYPGDRVVIVSLAHLVKKVEKVFSMRMDYF